MAKKMQNVFQFFFLQCSYHSLFFVAAVLRLRTTLTRSEYTTFQKCLDPDPGPDPEKTNHLNLISVLYE